MAEIVVNGVTPAVINAIYDATGVMMKRTPVTPERLWTALKAQAPQEVISVVIAKRAQPAFTAISVGERFRP